MSRAPHEIILASAGTGKTFRLARRYVRMLAEGTDHGSILATTFTRKAAREILARILGWLADGAAGGESYTRLTKDVYPDGDAPSDWSPERCQEILGQVTRELHRLHVRTLDSWFSSLARLFGLEIGLLPGWSRIDDRDDRRMRDEVLTALFEETDREELLQLLADLQGGDYARSVHSGQQQTIASGLEMLRDSEPGAWGKIDPGPAPSKADIQTALADFAKAPLPTTKKGAENKTAVKARKSGLEALERRDWSSFLGKGFGKKVLEQDYSYSGSDFPDGLVAAADACLRIAAWHLLDDLRRRSVGAHRLLVRFEERYQAAKKSSGRYLFEDIPQLIVAADHTDVHGTAAAYRAGGALEHLMLDEFQDTSVWQWRVIAPLVQKVIAGEHSSLFCVGDVKQSIYGWRQGERRLLERISDWNELGAPEIMSASHRSSQRVLDAVNAVFADLPKLAKVVPGMDARAADEWAEQWQDHLAAGDPKPGGARARIVSKPEDDPAWMESEVAQQVEEILAQSPGASVGVLVRTRKSIPTLLHELEALGIPASGEGGSELTDSQAVQLALSAFRLADAPHHLLAAYHLANSAHASLLKLDPQLAGTDKFKRAAKDASAQLRRELRDGGVGGLLERLRTGIEERFGETDWELQRFGQLVGLGEGFHLQAPFRPLDFVDFVETKPLENPAPSGVRVMTVHASKGLEFDAVVLPLKRGGGGRGSDLFLYSRPEPDRACSSVSRRPKQGLEVLDERLVALAEEDLARTQFESYCVLYVAMTRARFRLEILLEQPPKNGTSFNTAALVESALGVSEDTPWFVVDDFSKFADSETANQCTAAPPAAPISIRLAAPTKRRVRPHWSPSGSGAETTVDGSALFLRDGRTARERGLVMHRLFQEIEWLDEFQETDVALSAILVAEGVGEGRSHSTTLEDFRAVLEHRAVKEILRRHSYRERGEVEVWNEREFLVHAPDPSSGEDAILRGTFDRVVVEHDADRKPVSAHIIDFKTGAIEGGDDKAHKRELYRPQMEAYRTALQVMTGLPADTIRLSLLFVDAGQVLDL